MTRRPSKSRPPALPTLLAGLLLVSVALPAQAQKSTIQRSRGGDSGRAGISVGGRMHPASPARSGVSRGESSRLRGTAGRAPTLSPDFPLRGRGGSQGEAFVRSRPSSGEVQRAPSVRRFVPSRVRSDPSAVVASSGANPGGKRFLRPQARRRSHDRDRDWTDDRRWRRFRDHDGDTFIIFDPFFHDPFLRYHRFDRYRYFSGLGCGFYDWHFRWYPGYRFYDPCFSAFSLYLGWPWLADPWPGFWSSGYYSSRSGYGSDYRTGFDDGYSRGYASGRERVGEGGYGAGGQADFRAEGDYAASPLYDEGRRWMAAGDYRAALTAFDGYVVEVPADPAGHLARGLALAALGHYGKAADAFRDGLDAYPPWERPYLDAPAIFSSRGEFRRVVAQLVSFVRTHADNHDARFVLGVFYLFSGERGAARSFLSGLRDDPYARYLVEDLAEYR